MQVLIRDVSERRAVERMKDELLSVLGHELRTPLTSIRGSLGLLDGGVLGPLSPRGQRMMRIAVTNTDRLIRLLNDVLDVERMQAGRLVLERRPCAAAELVELAVAEMRGLAGRGTPGDSREPPAVEVPNERLRTRPRCSRECGHAH